MSMILIVGKRGKGSSESWLDAALGLLGRSNASRREIALEVIRRARRPGPM